MKFASFLMSALIALLLFAITLTCVAEDVTPPVSEETFTFVAGDRRDPFTFTKVIPRAADQAVSVDGGDDHGTPRMDAAQVAAKRAEILNYCASAENMVMETKYSEAMMLCERALDVVKDVRVNEYRELQDARDQVLRIHKVAERGKRRDEIERDFQIVNPHLTGVVISQRMPRAIINAKVACIGDVVQIGDTQATIFSIDSQRVTLIYKNYRVAVAVDK